LLAAKQFGNITNPKKREKGEGYLKKEERSECSEARKKKKKSKHERNEERGGESTNLDIT